MIRRPEDILPDEVNELIINGVKVRKGTLGAVFQAAAMFSDENATAQEKTAALNLLKELAPAVKALGVPKHVTFKNSEIQKLFE